MKKKKKSYHEDTQRPSWRNIEQRQQQKQLAQKQIPPSLPEKLEGDPLDKPESKHATDTEKLPVSTVTGAESEDFHDLILKEKQEQYKMLGKMMIVPLIIGFVFLLFQFFSNRDTSQSTVLYLDLNPSFALSLNEKQEIIAMTALNEEAEVVLASVDLRGNSLSEAFSTLLGLLSKAGYLQDSTTILATVENKNQSFGEALSVEVKEKLDFALLSLNSQVTTVGLWTDPAYGYVTAAEAVDVSLGKMILMEELSKMNFLFQGKVLLPFTLGELYQMYASGENTLPIGFDSAMELAKRALLLGDHDQFVVAITPKLLDTIPQYEVFFQTTDYEYMVYVHGFEGTIVNILERQVTAATVNFGITPKQAKEFALDYVKKLELQVESLVVQQDWTKGRLQYVVRFHLQDNQYDIHVLGSTGEVLGQTISPITAVAATDLGQDFIQELVFADAGVTPAQMTSNKYNRYLKDGAVFYELNFWVGNREYFYEVMGDGTIIQGNLMDYGGEESAEQVPLTETTAKDLALSHAGITFRQVSDLTAVVDSQGDFVVEFLFEGYLYSYYLSSSQHEVLNYDKQEPPQPEIPKSDTAVVEDIGEQEAKLIALAHANLKEVMIHSFDISKAEDGQSFQVLFTFGNVDFIYDISATTGEILRYDQQIVQATLPVVPEVEEPSTENNVTDLEQALADFNQYVADFNNSMSNVWS